MTDKKPKKPTTVPAPDMDEDRSPARRKDHQREFKPSGEDMPGAEGRLSAGANEDTYDWLIRQLRPEPDIPAVPEGPSACARGLGTA